MNSEKRRHKRYIFPKEKQITILLESTEHKTKIQAVLLNISMGGIGLVSSRAEKPRIKANTDMRIVAIEGASSLNDISGEKVEIRWVMEHEAFDNICFGCEFSGLPESTAQKLRKFIKN